MSSEVHAPPGAHPFTYLAKWWPVNILNDASGSHITINGPYTVQPDGLGGFNLLPILSGSTANRLGVKPDGTITVDSMPATKEELDAIYVLDGGWFLGAV
jgi:hypothetical protein